MIFVHRQNTVFYVYIITLTHGQKIANCASCDELSVNADGK